MNDELIEECCVSGKDMQRFFNNMLKNDQSVDKDELEKFLYSYYDVPFSGYCTLTKTNHIIEIQYTGHCSNGAHIIKIDADTYLEVSTGEIKKFNKTENRKDSYNSLRQTFKKLRYLINNNFVGNANELFITLTYKKNMKDSRVLYDDFRKFIKKLRYRFSKVSPIEYICVVEPQKRGAWHCHTLLKFTGLKEAYIASDLLSDLWGHGFVYVESLKDVDNIGAYLSAYLTDLPIDSDGSSDNKKFEKGARLALYPPGMNLYRSSRGIVAPERKVVKMSDIKKYVGHGHLTYVSYTPIEIGDFESSVCKFYYNLKR